MQKGPKPLERAVFSILGWLVVVALAFTIIYQPEAVRSAAHPEAMAVLVIIIDVLVSIFCAFCFWMAHKRDADTEPPKQ